MRHAAQLSSSLLYPISGTIFCTPDFIQTTAAYYCAEREPVKQVSTRKLVHQQQSTRRVSLQIEKIAVMLDNLKTLATIQPDIDLYRIPEAEKFAQCTHTRTRLLKKYKSANVFLNDRNTYKGLQEAASFLESATLASGDFCDDTARVKVTFCWIVLELLPMAENVQYTFTVQTALSNNLKGRATLVSAMPAEQTSASDECLVFNTYSVEVEMSGMEYSGSATLNRVTGRCTPGAPESFPPGIIINSCNFSYPQSYYTHNPARVTLTRGTGFVNILTDYSFLCPPPYVSCPVSGTFSYRSTGKSGWDKRTFAGLGGLIFLPRGDYEYRCTLMYGFGTSKEQTGAFTV